jgi:arylsulfatase A-like enzyme
VRPSAFKKVAAIALLAVAGTGCPSAPKEVVYDLAPRMNIAERWSAREVLLFGTPAAEPYLMEGFYREATSASDSFVWAKAAAEVSLRWSQPEPRAAILDLAPFRGVRSQSVEVRLNDVPVGRVVLNEQRYRYRVPLPAEPQRAGENRLRFVFAGTASPADADPKDADRRQLAAAFYSLTVGAADDAGLDDLLLRDAPRPFSVAEVKGTPVLTLIGSSLARFTLRLPPGAELRFAPELSAAARSASGTASFRVTVEDESGRGEPQVLWSRAIGARDQPPGEVALSLPGAPGDIVRIGLEVGASPGGRFAWGVWKAPRVLGRHADDPLEPAPPSAADDGRAEGLRRSLSGLNVLLVILDAARARQFGAYGYTRSTTPEINRIADEGVVFDRAFTPAVYTLGAMSSVWTSQHPDRHHSEVSFSARLPKDRLTLAEVLGPRGIRTAGFVANAVAGAGFGFDRGFDEFHEVFRDLGSRGDVFRRAVPPWLDATMGHRFFAYIHFREPHFPYDPEPPFDTKFGPDGPIPKAARRDQGWITDVNQGRRRLSPEEREHLVRLYDGNLAFADREVGALRKVMEAEGLWEKTVVIVAADHGEALFEHGWIGHNVQLYEESVQVPLIVRFPAGMGPIGVRVKELVDLLDVAPTIADIFGVRGQGGSDKEFQGRSLLPVIEGAPGKPAVLSRTVWDRPRYALRDERFKFLYDTRTGEEALYDVEADPRETKDRARNEPLRAAYYRQALHHWIAGLGRRRAPASEEATLTREQCENLKALGYLPGNTKCP